MPKQDDAHLILKLYDLRREVVMRQARTWFGRDFQPKTLQDVQAALNGEHGVYLRQITSYWDMAAALVLHGAIDAPLFHDTVGEHIFVYAKLAPYLEGLRKDYPRFLANVEKVVLATPGHEQHIQSIQARLAAMAKAAPQR
ncbi:MAG: DUF4760 domain-containing protein [Terriglobales bacterium]